MFSALIEALKAIIDLRKKAREDKKVGLEIEKLEDEQRSRNSLIQPGTIDDIHRYDPRVREIERRINREEMQEYYDSRRMYRNINAPVKASGCLLWILIALFVAIFVMIIKIF